jgi:hypothetical protein
LRIQHVKKPNIDAIESIQFSIEMISRRQGRGDEAYIKRYVEEADDEADNESARLRTEIMYAKLWCAV